MTSRRVLVTGAAAVVGAGVLAHVAGVDDDALRALGARPHPEPDPGDVRRLAAARREQSGLVEALADVAGDERAAEPLAAVAREQLAALGGAAGAPAAAPRDLGPLAEHAAAMARRREADALAGVSPDLVRVLASQSAGLAQLARSLGRLA